MLTTIIFFFALLLSYLTIRAEFNEVNDRTSNIMLFITALLWSYLYYLSH